MFGFKKKAEAPPPPKEFYAPQSGYMISLDKVPDPVFSGKILGDGFAVIPKGGRVFSPVAGTVIEVHEACHAYGIETADGLLVLVHIGVNTVAMGSGNFTPRVKVGQKINAGDELCIFDPEKVKAEGHHTHIIVLITNLDDIKSFRLRHVGDIVKERETIVLKYEK